MSFSYSGLTNYGKSTLPSVEAGLGSMNIIKDPPKSIMTRKITKVGENSSITQMIENSGDRSCESINVYARGVNPFVSVSYQNYGNNGGHFNSGNKGMYAGKQAYLPYNFKNGSFRPPVLTQKQLVPLSRQPRTSTSMFSKPGVKDYSKKIFNQPTHEDDVKGVRKDTIKTSIRPTVSYRVDASHQRSDNLDGINGVKKRTIKTSVRPTVSYKVDVRHQRSDDLSDLKGVKKNNILNKSSIQPKVFYKIQQPQTQPTGTYHNVKDIQTIQTTTNTGTSRITLNNPIHVKTSDFIQDHNSYQVCTNIKNNINVTPIDLLNDNDVRVKEIMNISHTPNIQGYQKHNILSTKVDLEKNLPSFTARTNTNKNIHVRHEHSNELNLSSNRPITQAMYTYGTQNNGRVDKISSRTINLPERTKRGGFDPRANKPTTQRISNVKDDIDSDKTRMNKKIMNQMLTRNSHLR